MPALSASSGSTPEKDEPESPGDVTKTHAPEKHKRSTDNVATVAHKDPRRGAGAHTHDEDEDYSHEEEQPTTTGRRKSKGDASKAPISEKRRQQVRVQCIAT